MTELRGPRRLDLRTAAVLGVGGFSALLLLLHVVEPEFSVVDEYTSDYALGSSGWIMNLAFFCMAIGVTAVGLGLRARGLPGRRATAAWVLVVVAGAAFVVVGLFETDPTDAATTTTHGSVHLAGAAVIFLGLLVATWLVRGALKRAGSDAARPAGWLALAFTVAFLNGFFLPTPVGLGQRILIAALVAWLLFLALAVLPSPDDAGG